MNNRFKFRVWDKHRKEYVERYVIGVDGWAYCLGDVGDDWYELNPNEDVIIEQCTGLKDKNGKLIFEGDFVQISFRDTTLRYCVRYDQASCQLYLSAGEQEFSESFEVIDNWSIEIIGNVHKMEVEKLRDCKSCHGTGYLKSRCDEPDRVCPICNGTGKDEE